MKGIPTKVKKVLQEAYLWDGPCLMCGGRNEIEAEHAISGMGGRSEHPLDIIPLCRRCHRGGPSGGHTDKEWCREAVKTIRSIVLDGTRRGAYRYFDANQLARIHRWSDRIDKAMVAKAFSNVG